VELTIDTASAVASVALTEAGDLIAEVAWQAGRSHAAELLPTIERLIDGSGHDRRTIRAVFVCRGPGGYGGLRVGISTALALALALDADVLGYGRLEADAWPWLALGRPVCAVHDAGRREYAWAVYREQAGTTVELAAPAIGPAAALVEALPPDALVAGEVSAPLRSALGDRHPSGAAAMRHAATAAAMLWPRFAAGARDHRLALTPLYLREPNITPPRPPTPTTEPRSRTP
jgi:tRNA threonylcarbamoyladenosine biosynthesis protein TsaB